MSSPQNPPRSATVCPFPREQSLIHLSETQINELIALESTLTIYQMDLLMKAYQWDGQLPLWGDPKRDTWIKEKKVFMYFTPMIWDDETLTELAQLKQLEKLSLLQLLTQNPAQNLTQPAQDFLYWQLTARGYLMVQWYRESIALYPKITPATQQ